MKHEFYLLSIACHILGHNIRKYFAMKIIIKLFCGSIATLKVVGAVPNSPIIEFDISLNDQL